jgi:hypothetical protein
MFLGQAIFPVATDPQIQMMMLVTMVIVSIANFYSVTLLEKQNSKAFYLVYGLLILLVFLLAAIIRSDFIILKAVREFYEIINLPLEYWLLTLTVSILSAGVLFTAQRLRKRVMGNVIHQQ